MPSGFLSTKTQIQMERPMRHFQQLSVAERHVMQKMFYSNISKNTIGQSHERHYSTIYREYKRNKSKGYQHEKAQEKADNRQFFIISTFRIHTQKRKKLVIIKNFNQLCRYIPD